MNDTDKSGKGEKRLRAAALRYERDRDAAPKMTARGEGHVAEKIIALAQEHNVPITRDPDLLTILSKMEIGSTINPALYEIVAELLVFIYRLKERFREEQAENEPHKDVDEHD